MHKEHQQSWIDHFRSLGHVDVRPLASGMEGAVYALGSGLVAKVWSRRQETDFAVLRRFYCDLDDAALPFGTPLIQDVQTTLGEVVTIERELQGTQLQEQLDTNDASLRRDAVDCLAKVLGALSNTKGTPSMYQLPVLGESRALWQESDTWADVLVSLMRRRIDQFGDQLRKALPDFDRLYDAVVQEVRGLPEVELTAIHGDLCGVNVLVHDRCEPTAVLDFGFLSTCGDPAFDAAITAGIYNMYGSHAASLRNELTAALASKFGYPLSRLLLYQAVYAIATSNVYDPQGQDGHFRWCVSILQQTKLV